METTAGTYSDLRADASWERDHLGRLLQRAGRLRSQQMNTENQVDFFCPTPLESAPTCTAGTAVPLPSVL